MSRIIKYIFYDILRTRFILLYTGLLLMSAFAMFQLDTDTGSNHELMNIVLMVVPL